jgi:hypothetical protein
MAKMVSGLLPPSLASSANASSPRFPDHDDGYQGEPPG